MTFSLVEVIGIAILSFIAGVIKMAIKNIKLKKENERLKKENNSHKIILNTIISDQIKTIDSWRKK